MPLWTAVNDEGTVATESTVTTMGTLHAFSWHRLDVLNFFGKLWPQIDLASTCHGFGRHFGGTRQSGSK